MRMGLLLLAANLASQSPAAARPNLVLILADDLGWADVSGGHTTFGGGSDFYETPNIARLASEGMSFTRAYACPNCTPTRAALYSGQYPTRTRVYNVDNLNRGNGTPPLIGPNQNEDIPADRLTLAEMLKGAGYVTAHFGKYHVGGHEGGAATLPENQGFDFNYGGSSAGNPGSYWASEILPGAWEFGGSVGPELDPWAAPYDQAYLDAYRTWAAPRYAPPSSLIGTPKHVGDALADAALQFMENQRAADQPFYVQFAQYLVHTPTQGRPDLKAKYDQKKLVQPSAMGHDHTTYAAQVEQFDQSLGRLLAYLNDPNGDGNPSDSLATNTLVLFYSDNGGDDRTVNTPWRGRKGMFTEGGLRVPLVAWWPGAIPAGVTNHTPVIMVDFYPTLAEIAGATLPNPGAQPLDGLSLAALLRGRTNALPERGLYWHFPGYLDTRATPCSTLIRELSGQRYKLLYYYEDQRYALYNLTADPAETSDLIGSSFGLANHWSAVTNLSADLRQWLDATGAIYPTNRASGQVVPPPAPLTGGPPVVSAPPGETTVNIDLVKSIHTANGPSGNRLAGVLGGPSPFWNTYTETNAQTVKAGLLDEQQRVTPVTFISHAPPTLAFGSNAGNDAFGQDGTTTGFFSTYQFLSGRGTPGTPGTNRFVIGGLVPDNQYDLVCYSTWNYTDAGSTFTIGSASLTATGIPSSATAPMVKGQSYVRFDQVAADFNGQIEVGWATFAPPGGAHRGPLNAVQIRGDFGQPFAARFRADPPAFVSPGTHLRLTWVSRPRRQYTLQTSSDLRAWSNLATVVGTSSVSSLDIPLAALGATNRAFLRLREQ